MPFSIRPYRRFPVTYNAGPRLTARQPHTLTRGLLLVRIPPLRVINEPRIEIPEAVVRWSQGHTSPERRQPEHEMFHKGRDDRFDRFPPNSSFLQRSSIAGVYAPLSTN